MTRGRVRGSTVVAKLELVREMLQEIRSLPLASQDAFLEPPHIQAAGESYLRRALEALLDLGRHVLAKGYAIAAVEYKDVPRELRKVGILDAELGETMLKMAGYRNRMVHFYHLIGPEELYNILSEHSGDLETLSETIRSWLRDHPDLVDEEI